MKMQAQFIHVGDIVMIKENEEFPCDLVLLRSSSTTGSCFIQTTNLDGESNMKTRQALNQTQQLPEQELLQFHGVVQCAAPNQEVYKFNSRMWMEASPHDQPPATEPISLSAQQLLPQATTLRNTDFIYGLSVYTGNETKFGQNKGVPRVKRTQVDEYINRLSVYLFVFQLALVGIFGFLGNLWKANNGSVWYLQQQTQSNDAWYEPFIIPARFLLLNSTIIPISLKVTLDLCKLYYARFISWDKNMYDKESDLFARANNTSISEDLGQVEYILSDKTGTLTENSMVFKKCSVLGELYDEQACASGGALEKAIENYSPRELDLLRNFVLNTSVVPAIKENGEIVYKSSSPDEEALVKAAARFGVVLLQRNIQHNHVQEIVIDVLGQKEVYVLESELEFSSDRKRMSVVVRSSDGNLLLYSKGADDALVPLLHPSQDPSLILNQVNEFAQEGLRTLFFCYRPLDDVEFQKWQEKVTAARTEIENREDKVAEAYSALEQNLLLQGCSAIEDKLQDKVPESIKTLREAGIKFWMLTGDKFSTALQIATSCNLRSSDPSVSKLCVIEGADVHALRECLERYVNELVIPAKLEGGRLPDHQEVIVVARGSSLEVVLVEMPELFKELCLHANSVICCRVTPAQKAQLVRLVKDSGHMTLAIGDGGNDVSMIQEAHVGVGIRGKEGLQASRAADYSISYFKALVELVLIHGRYSYIRTSEVAQYSFYKSFCFCTMQIGFAFVSGFSGGTLFNSMCIASYNALLFVPIVTFVLDRDLNQNTVKNFPKVYQLAAQNYHFNAKTFALWTARAFYHALVILLLTFGTRTSTEYARATYGHPADLESTGFVAFFGYLWVQCFTMLLNLHKITIWHHVFIWLFQGLAFLVLGVSSLLPQFDSLNTYYVVINTFGDSIFWLTNISMLGFAILPVWFIQYVRFSFFPDMLDRLRHYEASRLSAAESLGRKDSNWLDDCLKSIIGGGSNRSQRHSLHSQV